MQTLAKLAFNAHFQFANIAAAFHFVIDVIHPHAVVAGVVDPVGFHKRLEGAVFAIIHGVMPLDICLHTQARLQIAVGFIHDPGAIFLNVCIGLHVHPGDLGFRLHVQRVTFAEFSQFPGVARFDRGGDTVRVILFRRQSLSGDGVVEPVVEHPGIDIRARFIGVVGIPCAVQTGAVAADFPARGVSGETGMAAALAVGVTGHQTQMPAIQAVGAPLRNVAAQLHHITVALGAYLPGAVLEAVMSADVAHPQTGHLLLAG